MSPRKTKRDLINEDITITGRPVDLGHDETGGGPLEGGLRLMRALTFDIDDPELPYMLVITISAVDMQLACTEVTIAGRGGRTPVTGKAMRELPIQSYIALVRQKLMIASVRGNLVLMQEVDRTPDAVMYEPPSEDSIRDLESKQRKRVPPAVMLPAVAEIYVEALRSNSVDLRRAPTKAVADRLYISRGHASRLVTDAREAGLIGPAKRGVGGEYPDPEKRDE